MLIIGVVQFKLQWREWSEERVARNEERLLRNLAMLESDRFSDRSRGVALDQIFSAEDSVDLHDRLEVDVSGVRWHRKNIAGRDIELSVSRSSLEKSKIFSTGPLQVFATTSDLGDARMGSFRPAYLKIEILNANVSGLEIDIPSHEIIRETSAFSMSDSFFFRGKPPRITINGEMDIKALEGWIGYSNVFSMDPIFEGVYRENCAAKGVFGFECFLDMGESRGLSEKQWREKLGIQEVSLKEIMTTR